MIAWTKLIGFTEHPALARCEIETFRYRVLHIAARITPQRPTTAAAPRLQLALGGSDRHRLDSDPRRLHLTPGPLRPDET